MYCMKILSTGTFPRRVHLHRLLENLRNSFVAPIGTGEVSGLFLEEVGDSHLMSKTSSLVPSLLW
jgi:hypothetical protein